LIDTLNQRSITPVIPPKANRKAKRDCDFVLYCERNFVERFFNKSNTTAHRHALRQTRSKFPSPLASWSQLSSPAQTEDRP